MVLGQFVKSLINQATIVLLRPYIRRELPGWGILYNHLVGDHGADARWRGEKPRWIRDKLHGYEMPLDLGTWHNRIAFFLGRYYDLPTQLVLKALLRAGDSFVDIGANQGQISLLASSLIGPTGQVIAFEPNPQPRAKFKEALARNAITNVVVHPVGLADAYATLELSVPKVNSGEGSFGRMAYDPAELETISCQVQTGDVPLAACTPRLIKIDVEGYELHVLRGLDVTLARTYPFLLTEIISKHLANAGVHLEDLNAFLRERGYKAFRLGLRSQSMRKLLKLIPEMPTGEVFGDFLWAHADRPLPTNLTTAVDEPAPAHTDERRTS